MNSFTVSHIYKRIENLGDLIKQLLSYSVILFFQYFKIDLEEYQMGDLKLCDTPL